MKSFLVLASLVNGQALDPTVFPDEIAFEVPTAEIPTDFPTSIPPKTTTFEDPTSVPPKTTKFFPDETIPPKTTKFFPDETIPPQSDSLLSCFHCDAENFEKCQKIGKMKQCGGEGDVCMIELRKRDGNVSQVCMGCKSQDACQNNKIQNFEGDWHDWQCRPWAWFKSGPSVCRQCCNSDKNCATDFIQSNKGHGPWSKKGWGKNMLV
mgnify:CR=1 FL=1